MTHEKVYVVKESIDCEGSVVFMITLDKERAEKEAKELNKDGYRKATVVEHALDTKIVAFY